MSPLTFKDISSRLAENNLTPDEIADFRSYCASWLFRLYEQYGRLVSSGAAWQTEKRDGYKSQAETERAWLATEEGNAETETKYRIRGVEAMQDVLTSLYYQTNREMRIAQSDHGL